MVSALELLDSVRMNKNVEEWEERAGGGEVAFAWNSKIARLLTMSTRTVDRGHWVACGCCKRACTCDIAYVRANAETCLPSCDHDTCVTPGGSGKFFLFHYPLVTLTIRYVATTMHKSPNTCHVTGYEYHALPRTQTRHNTELSKRTHQWWPGVIKDHLRNVVMQHTRTTLPDHSWFKLCVNIHLIQVDWAGGPPKIGPEV